MVVPTDMSVSSNDEQFVQLRNAFLENLNSNGNYDDYEEVDLDRIRFDDNYCKRFLRQKKGNFQDALEMMDEALRWRKSFGVKEVTMAAIPLEFFQAKAVFRYNKDKEGNPIIMILVRYHKRAPEFAKELRRFVIYWVELMEEETSGGHMTVVMSCEGAGISNLDLDLIKFLITLFRSYYPDSLAHILIYEMPWILNPAWKIIKAWLPEDFVDKIKFTNKTSIQNYIDPSALPLDMGGTCTAEYEPPTQEDLNNAKNATEPKRVPSENGISRPSHVVITDDYTIIGGILKIRPAVQLVFDTLSDSSPNDVVIKLTSVSEKTISYKVKTNNIESYRVKPSLGIIEPGGDLDINVVLLSGFQPLPTDKFLIMAMEISDPSLSTANLNTLWKSSSPDSIADHKLKCVVKKDDKAAGVKSTDIENSLKDINSALTNLENKVHAIGAQQASVQRRQTVTMCLTLFLIFLFLCQMCLHTDSFWPSFLQK